MCDKALKFRLYELLTLLQRIQMDLKNDSKQKMKERIRMYNNSINDDELEEIIEDPHVSRLTLLMIRDVQCTLTSHWESTST